jgi:phosphoribosyl 1,2-cyclic phosphodiesterase
VRVTFCGVRGSTPAPGAPFVRYGGHTSCVAVAREGEAPSLVLDAGTGIRNVSALVAPGGHGASGVAGAFKGAILLGHLHWDHTQGLPFFAAADRDDAEVDLYMPSQGDAEEVLSRFMSPPHFPIAPSGLRGHWQFSGLEAGEHCLAGFSVLAREIPHKGGRTFGYRVSDGKGTIAYLSDHCPTSAGPGPQGLGEYHEAALELARDCDVLVHDAQYTDAELAERASFGHSACGYAVGLAEAAGAARLLLYHHDPGRTDDEVDVIVASCAGASVPVAAAFEGMTIDL